MTIKKKRNPQDATLRNIRALKKRIRALEVMVDALLNSIQYTYSQCQKPGRSSWAPLS